MLADSDLHIRLNGILPSLTYEIFRKEKFKVARKKPLE